MSLTEQINNDIKDAMRAKDKDRLAALRGIKSKLLLAATEAGAGEVSDEAGLKILMKLHKQHKDSAAIYKEQNREDLYAEEMAQATIFEAYLPEQMSEEELTKILSDIIAQTGAAAPSDMGKVMGAAQKQLAGKADGKTISSIVKKLLAN